MKLNFDVVVRGLNGEPLKDTGADGESKDMTFSSVVALCMLGSTKGDELLTGDKKFQMFKLAERAAAGGSCEFTVEEVAFLKERIARMYAPLIVGRAYEWIEGVSNDK